MCGGGCGGEYMKWQGTARRSASRPYSRLQACAQQRAQEPTAGGTTHPAAHAAARCGCGSSWPCSPCCSRGRVRRGSVGDRFRSCRDWQVAHSCMRGLAPLCMSKVVSNHALQAEQRHPASRQPQQAPRPHLTQRDRSAMRRERWYSACSSLYRSDRLEQEAGRGGKAAVGGASHDSR